MINKLTRNADKLTKSHSIYEATCPRGDCELPNPSYIGQTRNNILTRLININNMEPYLNIWLHVIILID